jgi:acetylornithine deacetylase/succinyl-diaminopimelate desuccinylase-like protein
VLGRTPKQGGVAYGTDGAMIAPSLGADMVICGPGQLDQLHQPNEWAYVDQLDQAVSVYKGIAKALLS